LTAQRSRAICTKVIFRLTLCAAEAHARNLSGAGKITNSP
jgi:hypothetical protein